MTKILSKSESDLSTYQQATQDRWQQHRTRYEAARNKPNTDLAELDAGRVKETGSDTDLTGVPAKRAVFEATFEPAKRNRDEAKHQKEWGNKYRKLADGQDELLRTSSTREFYAGMGDEFTEKQATLSDQQKDLATKVAFTSFEQHSSLRLNTHQSGFNVDGGESMQHPRGAPGSKGMFAKSGLNHGSADNKRAKDVFKDVHNKGPSMDVDNDIFQEMTRSATKHTLNAFTAAPFADNQKSGGDQQYQAKVMAHNAREGLKQTVFPDLPGAGTGTGAEAARQNSTTAWVKNSGRAVSPVRGAPPPRKRDRDE